MARTDYFSAACPKPWQILGITLRPFSLGHYLKLIRLECAFVSDEPAQAGLGDLALGLAVCSMSTHPDPAQDEFWCWMRRPERWSIPGFLFFHRKITPAESDLFWLGRRVGRFDFADKARLFSEYLAEHTREPGYWVTRHGEAGEQTGAHWAHAAIADLVAKCGYTRTEALNLPFNVAIYDCLRAMELEGAVRLKTDWELQVEEQINAKVSS